MKRTTISLTDELARLLEMERRRRGDSVSAIVRDVLEAHFGGGSHAPNRLRFAAIGSSGGEHGSAADASLATEWAVTIAKDSGLAYAVRPGDLDRPDQAADPRPTDAADSGE